MNDSGSLGTLLLVEDDVWLARAMARMVTSNGYTVVHVSAGDTAIDLVRSRAFDVVLSDLSLPGASGIEVLTAARATNPAVPLLLMSGSRDAASTIAAAQLGVHAYLSKPVGRTELASALDF
jgi:DNA-binding response OmpR family regulator